MFISRDVDKVHDLMDDVAEQQEIASEISDAISNPVGFGQDMDEVRFMMPQLYKTFFMLNSSEAEILSMSLKFLGRISVFF